MIPQNLVYEGVILENSFLEKGARIQESEYHLSFNARMFFKISLTRCELSQPNQYSIPCLFQPNVKRRQEQQGQKSGRNNSANDDCCQWALYFRSYTVSNCHGDKS